MAAQRLLSLGSRATVSGTNISPDAQQETQQRRDAARMLRMLPPAPTTRGVPGMPQPGGQKPPGPQGQAPAGGGAPPTQSRAMLQSLFPFDSISAMAAQPQQPGMPPAA